MNESVPDQTSICYRDNLFEGLETLNEKSVLDYIAPSSFWAPGCANDVAAAKGRTRASGANDMGISFHVTSAELPRPGCPGLFLVERRKKDDELASPTTQAVYYVLGGTAYEAPHVDDVLHARLRGAAIHLRATIQHLSSHVHLNLVRGPSHVWGSLDAPPELVELPPIVMEEKGTVSRDAYQAVLRAEGVLRSMIEKDKRERKEEGQQGRKRVKMEK